MRTVTLAAAASILAACNGTAGNGGVPSLFGSQPQTPAERAIQGCASGKTADFLHQDRPGGSDYSATRCSSEGD